MMALCFLLQNVLNITNNNFAAVQAYNLTVQALNFGTVLGTVSIKNVVSVRPLSMKTVRCDAVTTADRKEHTPVLLCRSAARQDKKRKADK